MKGVLCRPNTTITNWNGPWWPKKCSFCAPVRQSQLTAKQSSNLKFWRYALLWRSNCSGSSEGRGETYLTATVLRFKYSNQDRWKLSLFSKKPMWSLTWFLSFDNVFLHHEVDFVNSKLSGGWSCSVQCTLHRSDIVRSQIHSVRGNRYLSKVSILHVFKLC